MTYRISYYCSHRYTDARHTVISCSHITATYAHRTSVHACVVSFFLSYGSPCIYMYRCSILSHMIVSCYWYGFYVTGHESCWYAICGIPHLLLPFPVILFPLYCSMLSTELWSSYHVTRIMYSSYSCYFVYLIELTGVWGRLDGWLDHIGWCTGSILFSHYRGR